MAKKPSWPAWGLAVAASAGLLVGCSGVPTSGPVVAGNPVRGQEQPSSAGFIPAAPPPGADPAGIVDGFLEAMSAYRPDYDIAKQFLTPEAATEWDPAAGITIHRGTQAVVEAVDGNHVDVKFTVAGEVGGNGSYNVEDAGTGRELELTVKQVDGEWRIADPPEGTVISEDNFVREFEAHNVCFFDPEFNVLVPDPVYVPQRGQVATLLTKMLLRGPMEWLKPAVRTAFPESAQLSVVSVPVEAGVATVDLSAEAQDTEPPQRERMAAQLACTLSGLSEVTQLAMNADGVSLLGQNDDAARTNIDYERYDPDTLSSGGPLYAIQDGHVVSRVDDDVFEPVEGPFGGADDVTDIAVNANANGAVAVAAGGTELHVAPFDAEGSRDLLLNGTDLKSASWDRNDLVWAVNRGGSRGEIVALRPDGTPVSVRGSEHDTFDIDQLAISPDGTRMALVAGDEAYVAVVVHGGDTDDYVSIEGMRRIGPEGTALDVTWKGAERIVVLVREDDEDEPEPYVLDLFGAVRATQGPVPGAISITAGSGQQQKLVAETKDGMLMENDSRTHWTEIGEGRDPVYP